MTGNIGENGVVAALQFLGNEIERIEKKVDEKLDRILAFLENQVPQHSTLHVSEQLYHTMRPQAPPRQISNVLPQFLPQLNQTLPQLPPPPPPPPPPMPFVTVSPVHLTEQPASFGTSQGSLSDESSMGKFENKHCFFLMSSR